MDDPFIVRVMTGISTAFGAQVRTLSSFLLLCVCNANYVISMSMIWPIFWLISVFRHVLIANAWRRKHSILRMRRWWSITNLIPSPPFPSFPSTDRKVVSPCQIKTFWSVHSHRERDEKRQLLKRTNDEDLKRRLHGGYTMWGGWLWEKVWIMCSLVPSRMTEGRTDGIVEEEVEEEHAPLVCRWRRWAGARRAEGWDCLMERSRGIWNILAQQFLSFFTYSLMAHFLDFIC